MGFPGIKLNIDKNFHSLSVKLKNKKIHPKESALFRQTSFKTSCFFSLFISFCLFLALLILGVLPKIAFACPDLNGEGCFGRSNESLAGSFFLGNEVLSLNLRLEKGQLQELRLIDGINGKSIATGAKLEDGFGAFRLTLFQPGSGQKIDLGANDFKFFSFEASNPSPAPATNSPGLKTPPITGQPNTFLKLKGKASFEETELLINITYRLPSGRDYVETQLTVDPNSALEGWVVNNSTSARWKIDASFNPLPRDPLLDSVLYYQKRWKLPEGSTPGNWMAGLDGRGVYTFSNSPFGREYFQPGNLVLLDQYDHQALEEGFIGGPVVMGYFQAGGAEMGYSRFVNYLTREVSRMARNNKSSPVFFNTWIPWTNKINNDQANIALDQTKQAGYFDLLHIDAGWEGTQSLQIDTNKFPGGFEALQEKAHQQNMGLSLWINPYSDSYFGYVNYETQHREDRDWHVVLTEGYLPKQGFNRGAFQVLSPYTDYVEEKLASLVSNYDIRMLYWDGADWNIRDSEVDFLDNDARQRLKVLGMKRLIKITDRLNSIRPDLVLVGWNAWVDPHLLSVFDQEQVTDIFNAPLGLAESARRKIYYAMSYVMPFGTIWSDWYGLTYSERKDSNNLKLPENQLEYAELSMLAKGVKEGAASVDPTQAKPELNLFLKNLFSFRKRFDSFFDVYQRLSEAPDPNRADASGHFVDGKGFAMVNNPTILNQQITIGFNPALLGLKPGKTYTIYDWSDLKQARKYGSLYFNPDGRTSYFSISLPPRTVKILSLDIDNAEGGRPVPAQGKN